MRLNHGWLALLCLAPALRAHGQAAEIQGRWSIAVSLGSASFSGASRQTVAGADHPSFTPYGPTMWGLRVGYGGERLRIGIAVRYGQPGVRIRGVPSPDGETPGGSALAVLIENAYHLSTFMGTFSTTLHQLRSGATLRGSIGGGIERWAAPGAPIRTIGAAQAGLSLEAALGGSFVVVGEAELGFTPASPFRKDELPEEYEPRAAWRKTLAVALGWRF